MNQSGISAVKDPPQSLSAGCPCPGAGTSTSVQARTRKSRREPSLCGSTLELSKISVLYENLVLATRSLCDTSPRFFGLCLGFSTPRGDVRAPLSKMGNIHSSTYWSSLSIGLCVCSDNSFDSSDSRFHFSQGELLRSPSVQAINAPRSQGEYFGPRRDMPDTRYLHPRDLVVHASTANRRGLKVFPRLHSNKPVGLS